MKKLCILMAAAVLMLTACDSGVYTDTTSTDATPTPAVTETPTPSAPSWTSKAPENTNQVDEGENDMKAIITMKTVTVDKTDAQKPIVTIEMESGGIIKAELYPEIAPITVDNFVSLIEKGFYNGLIFHRNIPGFVIQGGCPLGTGTGGPGYQIKGEFTSNGHENNLKHTRGVLSMARAMAPDSAGSQFFIMHADAPHLDGDYAAFGKVIEGMEVVDQIANS